MKIKIFYALILLATKNENTIIKLICNYLVVNKFCLSEMHGCVKFNVQLKINKNQL